MSKSDWIPVIGLFVYILMFVGWSYLCITLPIRPMATIIIIH